MMNDVTDNELKIETPPTIGKRLRIAREAKNLTINDITTELRLTKHTIEHIENERWSELHGRAYARGYFSNYVRFLGLPEDELLAAFNLEYNIADPGILVVGKQDEPGNKKTFFVAFFLIIVASVLIWFAYQQWQKIENMDELLILSPNTPENPVILNDIYDEQSETAVPALQQEINVVEQRVNNDVQLSSAAKPIINTESVNEIPNKIDVVNDNVLAESKPLVILDVSLELAFNDESWVEVKDANSKVLLNQIMKKNDVIILNGPAPLSVMLGRAAAVKVKFNDKIFDASPYTQRNVARFTLGAES
jgi:cytoskeleton protein RodZ